MFSQNLEYRLYRDAHKEAYLLQRGFGDNHDMELVRFRPSELQGGKQKAYFVIRAILSPFIAAVKMVAEAALNFIEGVYYAIKAPVVGIYNKFVAKPVKKNLRSPFQKDESSSFEECIEKSVKAFFDIFLTPELAYASTKRFVCFGDWKRQV